MLAECNFECKL